MTQVEGSGTVIGVGKGGETLKIGGSGVTLPPIAKKPLPFWIAALMSRTASPFKLMSRTVGLEGSIAYVVYGSPPSMSS